MMSIKGDKKLNVSRCGGSGGVASKEHKGRGQRRGDSEQMSGRTSAKRPYVS